jgi:hypothetical protein
MGVREMKEPDFGDDVQAWFDAYKYTTLKPLVDFIFRRGEYAAPANEKKEDVA